MLSNGACGTGGASSRGERRQRGEAAAGYCDEVAAAVVLWSAVIVLMSHSFILRGVEQTVVFFLAIVRLNVPFYEFLGHLP
jgi:hypothetical protein